MSRDKLLILGVVVLGVLGLLVYKQEQKDAQLGQAVVAFLTAEQAQAAVAGQVGQWQLCANRTTSLNLPGRTPAHVTFGAPSTVADGVHEISLQVESNPSQQHCQRALTARNNIVVDISSCSMTLPDPAVRLADVIASKISQG